MDNQQKRLATLSLGRAFLLWQWWLTCLVFSPLLAVPAFLAKIFHTIMDFMAYTWLARPGVFHSVNEGYFLSDDHGVVTLLIYLLVAAVVFALLVLACYMLVRLSSFSSLNSSVVFSLIATPPLLLLLIGTICFFKVEGLSIQAAIVGPAAFLWLTPIMFILAGLFHSLLTTRRIGLAGIAAQLLSLTPVLFFLLVSAQSHDSKVVDIILVCIGLLGFVGLLAISKMIKQHNGNSKDNNQYKNSDHIGLPGSQALQGCHASKGNGRYQNQSKKGD